MKARAVFDLGAHLLSLSLVPPMSASTHIFGPYRIQNAELLSVGVYTNTAPTGPYRGSGRPVGVYLIERLMDEAARATNLDPVEIRRRNFIAPDAFPVSHTVRTSPTTPVTTRARSIAWWSLPKLSGAPSRAGGGAPPRRDHGDRRRGLRGIHQRARLGERSRTSRAQRQGHGDHRLEPPRTGTRDHLRPDHRRPAGRRLRGRDRSPRRHARRAPGDRNVRQP